MKEKRILIISVEVKVREYYSRLALALEAVKKGFIVIFGSSVTIEENLSKLPKGILFDKSISLNKSNSYQGLINRGFQIVAIDEEGLMCHNNLNKYITQRVNNENLSKISAMFVWGKAEADIIKNEYPQWKDKIIVSGNPRVDIMKENYANILYEEPKRVCNAKYGDYFFFPSNFTVNHALGKKGIRKNLESLGRITSEEDRAHYEVKFQYFDKMFHAYSDLIEVIAETFRGVNMVVRPHPSEDPSYWHDLSKRHKNLYVEDEKDPVTPWLMGAKMVIHSSCTTGLEAFLLGTYTLTYLPDSDHEYAKHISNQFSERCETSDEILKILTDHLNLGKKLEYTDKTLVKTAVNYIRNYEDHSSIDHMIDVIEGLDPVVTYELISRIKISPKQRLVDILAKIGISRSTTNYSLRKFPGLSKKELELDLSKFVSMETSESDLKIDQIGKDLFVISQQSK